MFYDNWVARDINGTALENAPFESIFAHGPSQERFMQHLPIQVQSCWNGIAILDPAPFYAPPHVRFRMARITEGECSASECSLSRCGKTGNGSTLRRAWREVAASALRPAQRALRSLTGSM